MKCIEKDTIITQEIIIKKSKFIGYLKYVSSENEAKQFIEHIKAKHSDANHNCSAYILDLVKKKDDDGEPTSTAGQPILDVLEYNNINNICAVVTRYFGGIKLGSGGLVRAYSKATLTTLDCAKLVALEKGYKIKLIFNYTNVKVIDHFLKNKNISINEKQFSHKVIYEFEILESNFDLIKEQLNAIDHTMELSNIGSTYIGV